MGKGSSPAGRSVRFLLLFHVQEDDAEQEEAYHHGKGTGIIRVCGGDKTLVLRVLQGTHRHLGAEDRQKRTSFSLDAGPHASM